MTTGVMPEPRAKSPALRLLNGSMATEARVNRCARSYWFSGKREHALRSGAGYPARRAAFITRLACR
jgi:hypothetical protein